MHMVVIVYNPCISQPCQHGGECINTTEGFACRCKGNHEGITCSGNFYAVLINASYTFQWANGCSHICSRCYVIACIRSLTHKEWLARNCCFVSVRACVFLAEFVCWWFKLRMNNCTRTYSIIDMCYYNHDNDMIFSFPLGCTFRLHVKCNK